jgi:hypothetical protein
MTTTLPPPARVGQGGREGGELPPRRAARAEQSAVVVVGATASHIVVIFMAVMVAVVDPVDGWRPGDCCTSLQGRIWGKNPIFAPNSPQIMGQTKMGGEWGMSGYHT